MGWKNIKTAIVAVIIVALIGGTAVILTKKTKPRPVAIQRPVATAAPQPVYGSVLNNTFNRVEPTATNAAQIEKLRANVWPGEKRATEEKIKSRQTLDETEGPAEIDLRPYINAQLNESALDWRKLNRNNLAALPSGIHIFGGVPFDVEGVIYLTGGWMRHYHKNYPTNVDDIVIDRRCAKIHLFHGAACIAFDDAGKTIAKLILNYSDGSQRELDIDAGKQVIDWWAPLFNTGVSPLNLQTSGDTEPAWTGSNELIKKQQPDESLVLCRTTFENPQPDEELSSIDYVSMNTMAVPFMLGLTVE